MQSVFFLRSCSHASMSIDTNCRPEYADLFVSVYRDLSSVLKKVKEQTLVRPYSEEELEELRQHGSIEQPWIEHPRWWIECWPFESTGYLYRIALDGRGRLKSRMLRKNSALDQLEVHTPILQRAQIVYSLVHGCLGIVQSTEPKSEVRNLDDLSFNTLRYKILLEHNPFSEKWGEVEETELLLFEELPNEISADRLQALHSLLQDSGNKG